MFCNFCEKFKNSKYPPFLTGKKKIFVENLVNYSAELPCGSIILLKSLYLARFLRYKHFVFCDFGKKIGKASLRRYPVGKKFCEIPLVNLYFMKNMVSKSTHISLSVLYVYRMSLHFQFCVLHFLSLIFAEEKFFGKLESSLFRYPEIEKFDEIALSDTVKDFCVFLVKKTQSFLNLSLPKFNVAQIFI